MLVQIVNNSENELPKYANPGDAGIDLRADFSKGLDETLMSFAAFDEVRKCLLIFPGGRALIPTNIHVALPEGYELQVRPRSSLAIKQGVTVLNTPGCVDAGYRNSVGVILINLGEEDIDIFQGDRIAQAVLKKFETIEWEPVIALSDTVRGLTGFGASGVK